MEFSGHQHFLNYCRKILMNQYAVTSEYAADVLMLGVNIVWQIESKVPYDNRIVRPTKYFTKLMAYIFNSRYDDNTEYQCPTFNDVIKMAETVVEKYNKFMLFASGGNGVDVDEVIDIFTTTGISKLNTERVKHYVAGGHYCHIKIDTLKGVSGIYRLYDINMQLIYVGKSVNLGERIPSSSQEKRAVYYDYAMIENLPDMPIYEAYYISKLNPPCNVDGKHNGFPSVSLPEIEFSPPYKWSEVQAVGCI